MSQDRAKLNALFHNCQEVLLSSITNHKTCNACQSVCTTQVPFDLEISRYTVLLQKSTGNSHDYPSADFFNYFVTLDSCYTELRDEGIENSGNVYSTYLKSVPVPIVIPNCHDLKNYVIKSLIQHKLNAEKLWKMRKTKHDSRSMFI